MRNIDKFDLNSIIVYQDEIILALNKPQDMPTQSSQFKKNNDLYSLAKEWLSSIDPRSYLALHHRLDAATSGIVLFCKRPEYNKFFTELFRDKKIKKSYLALCCKSNSDTISSTFQSEQKIIEYKYKHYKLAKISDRGKDASTQFELIKQNDHFALIKCYPKTGRLHQIRIHLKQLGLPIVGDFHYGSKHQDFSLCLHAEEVEFFHPKNKKKLTLKAEINANFNLALDRLIN
jgi:RluA family pseudouridine synthase